DRQTHEERGAFAFAVALRVRRAAVELDDAADDREPDAEAALRARDRGVGLPELLEDVRQERGRDAASVVADADLGGAAEVAQQDFHVRALGAELDRVREEIPQHLLEAL